MSAPTRLSRSDAPDTMRALPRDAAGKILPYFLGKGEGIDPAKWSDCVRFNRCWLCGTPMGSYKVFILGAAAVVNRISGDPPAHRDCARFLVQAQPEVLVAQPELMFLWTTKTYSLMRWNKSRLLEVGPTMDVSCWLNGRPATRAELDAALETVHAAFLAHFHAQETFPGAAEDDPRVVRARLKLDGLERQYADTLRLLHSFVPTLAGGSNG